MKHIVFDWGNTGEWIVGVGLLFWMIQYTIYAPWWNNWLGRSLFSLAVSYELIFWPSMYQLAFPTSHFLGSDPYDYLETANVTIAAVVVIALIVGFYRVHKAGKLRRNGDKGGKA